MSEVIFMYNNKPLRFINNGTQVVFLGDRGTMILGAFPEEVTKKITVIGLDGTQFCLHDLWGYTSMMPYYLVPLIERITDPNNELDYFVHH